MHHPGVFYIALRNKITIQKLLCPASAIALEIFDDDDDDDLGFKGTRTTMVIGVYSMPLKRSLRYE